jgi:hypothetical protein
LEKGELPAYNVGLATYPFVEVLPSYGPKKGG